MDTVFIQESVKRFLSRPRLFAVIGVLGVILAAAILGMRSGKVFSYGHETRNGTPAGAYAVRKDPEPLPKVTDSTSGSPASASSDSSTGTGTVPAEPAVPVVKQNDPDGCDARMELAKQAYDKEIQKKKTALDSTLSFKFGLNMTSQFVSDYNTEVAGIFNKYAESAQSNACVWPVKEPALLPSNYTR